LSDIFNTFSLLTAIGVLSVVLVHILSRLFGKKEPVKLDKNSFVMITGACIGIGKEMILELAQLYHCRILVIDLKSELFDDLSREINALGGNCECRKADLCDQQSVEELLKYLLERNEKIDLFIYNAGILCAKKTWDITEREHEMLMRVNYFTPVTMIKKLEPLLSHIAVTGSMASIMPGGTNVSIYSASKHAIVSYLSSLRQEYKKYNKKITLSIGCPYAINTTMIEGFKTHMDFIFRILDQKYVGKRLVHEYIEKKELCYVYEYEALIFKLLTILPTNILDFLAIRMDISSMKSAKMLENHEK
jgi:3-oxoacyl-[acyl-carrier protein] reductase